ncbi:MAG: hypothetical protein MUO76_21735 [Anaerolineaceae bacterium]|nr:hypothetical protein [Anaerolineaceae bacterium]
MRKTGLAAQSARSVLPNPQLTFRSPLPTFWSICSTNLISAHIPATIP